MEPLALASDTSLSGLVATLSERYDPTNADHTAALRQLWELAWPETPWEAATGASEVSPSRPLVKSAGNLAAASRQLGGSLAVAAAACLSVTAAARWVASLRCGRAVLWVATGNLTGATQPPRGGRRSRQLRLAAFGHAGSGFSLASNRKTRPPTCAVQARTVSSPHMRRSLQPAACSLQPAACSLDTYGCRHRGRAPPHLLPAIPRRRVPGRHRLRPGPLPRPSE